MPSGLIRKSSYFAIEALFWGYVFGAIRQSVASRPGRADALQGEMRRHPGQPRVGRGDAIQYPCIWGMQSSILGFGLMQSSILGFWGDAVQNSSIQVMQSLLDAIPYTSILVY